MWAWAHCGTPGVLQAAAPTVAAAAAAVLPVALAVDIAPEDSWPRAALAESVCKDCSCFQR